jgi:hypothetical protein
MSDDGRTTSRSRDEYRHRVAFDEFLTTLLGEGGYAGRRDADGKRVLTVVDLTAADTAAIMAAARANGIADSIRIERADPAAVAAWARLRSEIQRLERDPRDALLSWPTPMPSYQHPPIRIHLAAHAEDIAADLHRRYDEFVALTVGALPYPPSSRPIRSSAASRGPGSDPVPADPDELQVELDQQLTVRSGHNATGGLLVTNASASSIAVETNGCLTAQVVDPATGVVVGGYAGFQVTPLVTFHAAPGDTVRVPLVVGTASQDQTLGYAVPPGRWALVAIMSLADGRRLKTPLLEFVIT